MFPWTRSTSLGVLIVPLHKHICQHGPLYNSATLFHIHFSARPDHQFFLQVTFHQRQEKSADWVTCRFHYIKQEIMHLVINLWTTYYNYQNINCCLWLKEEWDQRADPTSCTLAAVVWLLCFPCLLHYWGGCDIVGFSWCGSCWLRSSGNPIPFCSVARGQLQ